MRGRGDMSSPLCVACGAVGKGKHGQYSFLLAVAVMV